MLTILKYILYAILLIAVLDFIAIYFVAPYFILKPVKINGEITPKNFHLTFQTLNIEVEPNLNLKGYWTHSKTDRVKGIIIFAHGIGGCKESYIGVASKLAQKGIESILVDSRAHGESEGKFCTYGFYEQADISKIIDFIQLKQPDIPVGIWGSSMGGAISLLALAKDKRLQFGLIQSTFTDLHQIVFDYKKRILRGFGSQTMVNMVLKRAGEIANFNPNEVKPIEAVKHIEQPIIIAHGDADKNISYQYGQQLFDNLKSVDKEFYLVKNGGHVGLWDTGGKAFEDKMIGFIERQLSK
ncbi:MAG: alpha/beta hydrolase [Saprospiraceae bacterium]